MQRWENNWQPVVGDVVALNEVGYDILHLRSLDEFEDSKRMRITHVENIGTREAPIWTIDVDKPSINKFLLDATMVKLLV